MAKARRSLEEMLPQQLTTKEFFLQIAPLIAKLQDGHTSIPIPSAAFFGEESRKLLPLEIEFENDLVRVVAGYTPKAQALVGTVVDRINGKDVNHLVTRMMKHQHQELLPARKRRIAEYFRAYLWLVCNINSPFEVEFCSAGNRESKSVTLIGKTLASITAAKLAQNSVNPSPYVYRFFKNDQVGLIEYNACINDDTFRKFLKSTFTRIQHEKPVALIVDARMNGGGSAYANVALFDYLTTKPYRMYSQVKIKVSQNLKDKLGREEFEKNYFPWETPIGTIQTYEFPLREPGTNELRYKGPLIVLSGTSTLSSGMNFVNAVKDYELGIVVGDETGNPATMFGDIEAYTLPHSGLNLYVSTKYFVRPNGSIKRHGVLPDHNVRQNAEDTRAGRDTVLEFAKRLAREMTSDHE